VLTETEAEYVDLGFIYPQIPFDMVGFYPHLQADPQDELAALGYNVPSSSSAKKLPTKRNKELRSTKDALFHSS